MKLVFLSKNGLTLSVNNNIYIRNALDVLVFFNWRILTQQQIYCNIKIKNFQGEINKKLNMGSKLIIILKKNEFMKKCYNILKWVAKKTKERLMTSVIHSTCFFLRRGHHHCVTQGRAQHHYFSFKFFFSSVSHQRKKKEFCLVRAIKIITYMKRSRRERPV